MHIYNYIILAKPSPPADIMVIHQSITDTTFTLQWTPGYDGGERQTFVLHYKITNSVRWNITLISEVDTRSKVIRQYISGLQKGSTYQLYLTATNSYGSSNRSEMITIQTKREFTLTLTFSFNRNIIKNVKYSSYSYLKD